ncbi:SMC-Scp complex subunit ScpB [Micromonospora sp. NPDC005189]|uniref:SMC-Scp complex subunit ScpB n=1 Tax=unclassified Micromonospora TaxID=2617518 RepID=UPI0033ACAAC3
MSDEERGDSLADQAAAWVPPWERPRPSAPASDETSDETDEDPNGEPPSDTSAGEPAPGDPALGEPALGEPALSEPEPGEPALGQPSEPTAAAGDVPHRLAAGRRRAPAVPEPAPELSDAELRGALEAILLVVDEPVSELVLAQVLEQPAERVGPMLDEIAAGYTATGHGFELRRAAGGWRLYTRPEYATYVERFVLDGQSVRLTQAALETLAVVAYKQPVTRSRISAIRGVNCDGVIRTLVTRGLVEECGTEQDSGAFLYRTTTLFLEKLGLNTVDELPPLAPFLPDDVEELADATR